MGTDLWKALDVLPELTMRKSHRNDTPMAIVNGPLNCDKTSAGRSARQQTGELPDMKSRIKKIVTAAALSVAVVSPSFAMQNEVNMLAGTIFNMLSVRNMDTASMNNLTLSEINQISSIVHSGDTESEKDAKISSILRRAASR